VGAFVKISWKMFSRSEFTHTESVCCRFDRLPEREIERLLWSGILSLRFLRFSPALRFFSLKPLTLVNASFLHMLLDGVVFLQYVSWRIKLIFSCCLWIFWYVTGNSNNIVSDQWEIQVWLCNCSFSGRSFQGTMLFP
jgi:hypothetical protein